MRRMQLKITMNYHYTIAEKIIIASNISDDTKKLDHSYIAGGNVKWYGPSGKRWGSFLKTKYLITIQPNNCTLGHFREIKI